MSGSTKNSSDLMISVSGIRGKIPGGLNLESILLYTNAFIETIQPKTVVLGRDSRPSGLFIENLITGVLLSKGIHVVSLGIVPTPTVKAVVKSSKASAGIMISASHNPLIWNAFKLIGKNGFFFNKTQIDALLYHLEKNKFRPPSHMPNSTLKLFARDQIQSHIESVLKRVDVESIKKRKYKVFVDAVNGGGSLVIPELLKQLGCKVYEYSCDPTKVFPREPEPTPEALKKTSREMKRTDAQIGFALDPDADRLVLLTPFKGAISEEYTLPMSARSVLPSSGKKMVINLSTSFINEDVMAKEGKIVLRSAVGEANVVSEMLAEKAFFGGEGNGGVIDPMIDSYGRDSLSGIAHILNLMAREKSGIDSLVDEMPQIYMQKVAIPIRGKDVSKIFKNLKDSFYAGVPNEKDGLRIEFENSWFHVRASNTEPILRVIAEARSQSDLKNLIMEANTIVEKY